MWRARDIIYISLPFKRTLIWISVPNGPYAKPHSPGEWYCRSCGLLRDAVKWEVHRLLGVHSLYLYSNLSCEWSAPPRTHAMMCCPCQRPKPMGSPNLGLEPPEQWAKTDLSLLPKSPLLGISLYWWRESS
jgi:hypothetical protein